MQKFSPENFLPLPRNRKNRKDFTSLMTSMTMFAPCQNPSNFVVNQKSKLKSDYTFL